MSCFFLAQDTLACFLFGRCFYEMNNELYDLSSDLMYLLWCSNVTYHTIYNPKHLNFQGITKLFIKMISFFKKT